MKILRFRLNGLSGILMHNPQSMSPPEQGITRKVIPSPEEEARDSRYLLNGKLCVPAAAILASTIQGAKGYRIGKRSAADILAGAINGKDEYFPLLRDGNPIDGEDFVIDSRRAVVQRQGIIRSRAKVELPWQVEAYYEFNDEIASTEHVKIALTNAGQTVGLLDGRAKVKGSPSPGLWFGKFEVTDIWTE